ncbi:unnamed protein product [Alopecurus aequalis]
MLMDAGATSKDSAAGKGEERQEGETKKKVPVKRKKAEEPSVRKRDSTVEVTRRPAPVYKLTIPIGDDNPDTFSDLWMRNWGDEIESMEQETTIPSVRFTDDVNPAELVSPISTLQFLEVKIDFAPEEPFGLPWPLRVYGFIAARDAVDYKRNIIFKCNRDNYQLVDEESPYLLLTGPKRAVVLVDPVYFEVDLKVKGAVESEDKDLIFLAEPFDDTGPLDSSVFKCVYTGEICKLELTFGHIVRSVEAAISMKVIRGSWPDGLHAFFGAKTSSISNMEIPLLVTCYGHKLPLADDGTIKLQRHVVCAELRKGEDLEVFVNAEDLNRKRLGDALIFKPQGHSYLRGTLEVGSCEIEVTVTWSLISW